MSPSSSLFSLPSFSLYVLLSVLLLPTHFVMCKVDIEALTALEITHYSTLLACLTDDRTGPLLLGEYRGGFCQNEPGFQPGLQYLWGISSDVMRGVFYLDQLDDLRLNIWMIDGRRVAITYFHPDSGLFVPGGPIERPNCSELLAFAQSQVEITSTSTYIEKQGFVVPLGICTAYEIWDDRDEVPVTESWFIVHHIPFVGGSEFVPSSMSVMRYFSNEECEEFESREAFTPSNATQVRQFFGSLEMPSEQSFTFGGGVPEHIESPFLWSRTNLPVNPFFGNCHLGWPMKGAFYFFSCVGSADSPDLQVREFNLDASYWVGTPDVCELSPCSESLFCAEGFYDDDVDGIRRDQCLNGCPRNCPQFWVGNSSAGGDQNRPYWIQYFPEDSDDGFFLDWEGDSYVFGGTGINQMCFPHETDQHVSYIEIQEWLDEEFRAEAVIVPYRTCSNGWWVDGPKCIVPTKIEGDTGMAIAGIGVFSAFAVCMGIVCVSGILCAVFCNWNPCLKCRKDVSASDVQVWETELKGVTPEGGYEEGREADQSLRTVTPDGYEPGQKMAVDAEEGENPDGGYDDDRSLDSVISILSLPIKVRGDCTTVCTGFKSLFFFVLAQIKEFKSFLLLLLVVELPVLNPNYTEWYNSINLYVKIPLVGMSVLVFIVDTIGHLIFMRSHLWRPLGVAIFYGGYKESLVRRIIFGISILAVFVLSCVVLITAIVSGVNYFSDPRLQCKNYIRSEDAINHGLDVTLLYQVEDTLEIMQDNRNGAVCTCVQDCLPSPFEILRVALQILTPALACLALLGAFFGALNYNGPSCPAYVDGLEKVGRNPKVAARFPRVKFGLLYSLIVHPDDLLEDVITTVNLVESETDVQRAIDAPTTSHYRWEWITKMKSREIQYLKKWFTRPGRRNKETKRDVLCYSNLSRPQLWNLCCPCCGCIEEESSENKEKTGETGKLDEEGTTPKQQKTEEVTSPAVLEVVSADDMIYSLRPHTLDRSACCWCCCDPISCLCTSGKSLSYFIFLQISSFQALVLTCFIIVIPNLSGDYRDPSMIGIIASVNTYCKLGFLCFAVVFMIFDTVVKLIFIRDRSLLSDAFRLSLAWSEFKETLFRRVYAGIMYFVLFVSSVSVLACAFVFAVQTLSSRDLGRLSYLCDGTESASSAAADSGFQEYLELIDCDCSRHCIYYFKSFNWQKYGLEILTTCVACVTLLTEFLLVLQYDGPSSIPFFRHLRKYCETGLINRFPNFSLNVFYLLMLEPETIVGDVLTTIGLVNDPKDILVAETAQTTSHRRWNWIKSLSKDELLFLKWFFLRKRYDEFEPRKDRICYGRCFSALFCSAVCCCCCMLGEGDQPPIQSAVDNAVAVDALGRDDFAVGIKNPSAVAGELPDEETEESSSSSPSSSSTENESEHESSENEISAPPVDVSHAVGEEMKVVERDTSEKTSVLQDEDEAVKNDAQETGEDHSEIEAGIPHDEGGEGETESEGSVEEAETASGSEEEGEESGSCSAEGE